MSVANVVKTGVAIAGAVAQGVSALKAGSSNQSQKPSFGQVAGTNFLDLLITQIVNQNPLEPMSNETMVAQMTAMQTLDKIETLNERVNTLMIHQNLMNSTNLIGKYVRIYDSYDDTELIGKVEGIKIERGFPGVVVNGQFYDVTKVQEIAQL
jgi:flagellar basal-body rod modification protein FlgD